MTKNKKVSYSKLPEYQVWASMKHRCDNPNHPKWNKNFGGRGISYQSSWNTFENFFQDMGSRPSKDYALTRIDANGDYTLENCKWSLRKKRIHYLSLDDRTMSLEQWSEEIGIRVGTLQKRKFAGWTDREILTFPVRDRGSKDYQKNTVKNREKLLIAMKVNADDFRTVKQWADEVGITQRTANRILKTMTDENIIKRSVENSKRRDHGTRFNPFLYGYRGSNLRELKWVLLYKMQKGCLLSVRDCAGLINRDVIPTAKLLKELMVKGYVSRRIKYENNPTSRSNCYLYQINL